MIDSERYEELKNQMVWIKFCHTVRATRDRGKSRVEYDPILVKLSDAISMVEEPEKW